MLADTAATPCRSEREDKQRSNFESPGFAAFLPSDRIVHTAAQSALLLPAMASLARSSTRLLRSATSSAHLQAGRLSRKTGINSTSTRLAQAASLHTSARLQRTSDKKITEEEARQIAATHHHGRSQQLASQTPAIDLMTGEMRMEADIDVRLLLLLPNVNLITSLTRLFHTFLVFWSLR